MSPIPLELPCWVDLREYAQDDGVIVPVEFKGDTEIPFVPKRMFYIRNVPAAKTRGDHAHKTCKQFFIPVSGTFEAELVTKLNKLEVLLDNPRRGLYVPPLTWVRLSCFDADTVCLVLASEHYDAGDYIHDQAELEKLW